jgi:hypothetical protein
MTKNKLTLSRLFGGKTFIMAGLAIAMLLSMAQQAMAQSVSVMPSNSQNRGKYGISIKNQQITLWGRAWGGSGSYQYKWTVDGVQDANWHVPGDGFDNHPSFNESNSFIPRLHTFGAKGPKVVTLTVKENGADDSTAVSRSAEIDVREPGEHEDEVNVAIEYGLLNLYNRATRSGSRAYWDTAHRASASTPLALLAFAENGHLPGNDRVADVYSEIAQHAVNFITEGNGGYLQSTTTSGEFDHNGNNKGAYTSWAPVYASGIMALGVTFSYPTAEAAKSATIAAGPHAGSTIYEFIGDVLDQFWVAKRGDGGWVYNMTGDGGRLDGSAQQWVALAQRTAIDRWGYPVKPELSARSVLGFQNTQFADGGCSYLGGGSWTNAGMTGGSLVGFSLGDKWVADGDDNAVRAANYIGQNFYQKHTSNYTIYETLWAGNGDYYTAFGIKKGLAIQEIETINTPELGSIDWQREIDDWLLGKTTHNHHATPKSAGNAFGQGVDGSWQGNLHGSPTGYGSHIRTSHAILLLNRGVTKALPVAEIVVASDTFAVGASFIVDGSTSYHADPANRTIVAYNWDFEIGGETGTATGVAPVVPANLVDSVGDLNVTLTVVDDLGSTDSTDTVIHIVDPAGTPVPPISIAIPAAQAPNYEGRPGQTVTLDGSESYDPNPGETIVSWCWDLNGDGIYGDSVDDALTGQDPAAGSSCGQTIDVIFNEPKTLTVGLRVVSSNPNDLPSDSVADVLLVYTESDLSVPAISAVYDEVNNSAVVTATVALFEDVNAALNVDTRIRFFFGGRAAAVELSGFAQGQQDVSITIEDALAPGETALNVLAMVDPDGQVNEFNEDNNTNSTVVSSNQPPVLVLNPEGFSADADGDCQAVITASQLAAGTSDPDGDELTITADPAGPYGLGTTVVTVTVTDGKETVSGTISVTVTDLVPPVLVIPADQTLECPADTSFASTGSATATDNCLVDVSYNDVVTETCGSTYTVVRTWTAIDGSGNSVSGDQLIVVQDTTAPALVGVPADVTVECDSVPAVASVSATDACDAPSLVFDEVKTDGTCVGSYTLTRTWTATDACGNVTVATQVVTVEDTTAPVIASDAADITPADAPVTFQIAASDNCDVALAVTYSAAKTNAKGKVTDKTADTIVEFEQADSGLINVTIVDAGGNGNVITFVATATDGCNTTITTYTVNVVSPSSSEANEGVGNGVDGNTPGHDNNGGNDDPGNTPGNPGAKGKKK